MKAEKKQRNAAFRQVQESLADAKEKLYNHPKPLNPEERAALMPDLRLIALNLGTEVLEDGDDEKKAKQLRDIVAFVNTQCAEIKKTLSTTLAQAPDKIADIMYDYKPEGGAKE